MLVIISSKYVHHHQIFVLGVSLNKDLFTKMIYANPVILGTLLPGVLKHYLREVAHGCVAVTRTVRWG